MDNLRRKNRLAKRRAYRVRASVTGTAERPRLSVSVSNLHITAQLVDDTSGKTLAYASTIGKKIPGNMTQRAEWVGGEIAKTARKVKLNKIVFDRGAKKYHGRIRALADAARKEGLEF